MTEQFRLSFDGLLDNLETHQLGRLLIAFQAMEEAIRVSFPRIIGLSDRFGITDSLTGGWTATRKATEAVRIIDRISTRFKLPPAEADWKFTSVFGEATLEDDTLAAAEALATVRDSWQSAKDHLEYRNQLFHGVLHEKEGTLTIRTGGAPIPFRAEGFAKKRDDILGVAVGVLMATASAVAATKWLCNAQAVEGQSET